MFTTHDWEWLWYHLWKWWFVDDFIVVLRCFTHMTIMGPSDSFRLWRSFQSWLIPPMAHTRMIWGRWADGFPWFQWLRFFRQCSISGWWFGCHEFYFPINIGLRLSSQLTKSYFSEGWPNHQADMFGGSGATSDEPYRSIHLQEWILGVLPWPLGQAAQVASSDGTTLSQLLEF